MSEVLSRQSLFDTLYTLSDGELGESVRNDLMLRVDVSHEALRERVEKLGRVAEAAKKVTPYIPEVGDYTHSYKALADETGVVTQEVQGIIWGWANDYDDALAALEADDE